jgi:hypothetical protein
MANLTRSTLTCGFAMSALLVACDVPETATGLHPDGPPKIQQVLMKEQSVNATGSLVLSSILAFGTHDAIPEARTHATLEGSPSDQVLRIVFDELLVGNSLEEISCRTRQLSETESCVVPGGFSRVPLGATPDDIADCAAADDLLDDRCNGTHAVCLDDGHPCGVQDEDENGSADDTRLIAGQVRIVCGGTEVMLNQQQSYWQPAGNQLIPAGGTPEGSLGPALLLRPINDGRMPTNSDCELILADDVTDKDGIRPCTPEGGNPDADCNPGDLSRFTFKTQRLRFSSTDPENNRTGVSRASARISTYWNAAIDPASIASAVTVTPALPNMFVSLAATNPNNLIIQGCTDPVTMGMPCVPVMFDAATEYTVTIQNLTDTFGKAQPTAESITFTTSN